jgi:hypothetical protein
VCSAISPQLAAFLLQGVLPKGDGRAGVWVLTAHAHPTGLTWLQASAASGMSLSRTMTRGSGCLFAEGIVNLLQQALGMLMSCLRCLELSCCHSASICGSSPA